MNVTPTQLRKIIDESRLHWLKTHKMMETYEAIVEDQPGMQYVPGIQKGMKEDLKELRDTLRNNAAKARRMAETFEKVLVMDEAENWWKGEDRFVELAL